MYQLRLSTLATLFLLSAGAAACGGTDDNGDANTTDTAADTTGNGTSTDSTASTTGSVTTSGADTNGGTSTNGDPGSDPGTDTQTETAPSTEGLTFSGSCLYADYCSDQYGGPSFNAATLQQFCVAQSGVWSTGHCDQTPWEVKCTQSMMGGVYVHFQPEDGICFQGVEETLP